jgi:hypothetical protein
MKALPALVVAQYKACALGEQTGEDERRKTKDERRKTKDRGTSNGWLRETEKRMRDARQFFRLNIRWKQALYSCAK